MDASARATVIAIGMATHLGVPLKIPPWRLIGS
jgi:hypothetical protein